MRRLSLLAGVMLVGGCTGTEPIPVPESAVSADSARVTPRDDMGAVLAWVGRQPLTEADVRDVINTSGRAGRVTPDALEAALQEGEDRKLLLEAALRSGLDQDPGIQRSLVGMFLRTNVYADFDGQNISDEEIQTYYEANIDAFSIPPRASFRQAVFRARAGEDEAALRVRAEACHSALAERPGDARSIIQELSDGPFRGRGGEVGEVTPEGKAGVVGSLLDLVFAAEPGQLTDIVELGDASTLALGLVQERSDRVVRNLEEPQVRSRVFQTLKQSRQRAIYDAFLADLRAGTEIDRDEAALETFRSGQVPGVRD